MSRKWSSRICLYTRPFLIIIISVVGVGWIHHQKRCASCCCELVGKSFDERIKSDGGGVPDFINWRGTVLDEVCVSTRNSPTPIASISLSYIPVDFLAPITDIKQLSALLLLLLLPYSFLYNIKGCHNKRAIGRRRPPCASLSSSFASANSFMNISCNFVHYISQTCHFRCSHITAATDCHTTLPYAVEIDRSSNILIAITYWQY